VGVHAFAHKEHRTMKKEITYVAIESLKPHPGNARVHSKKQIAKIADSIKAFGFHGVVLIDENHTIIAGHGRVAAAKLVSMKEVPTVKIEGLSPAKLRALMLADNRIALDAGWNRETLAVEIPALTGLLIEEGLGISSTGFEAAEIDQIVVDFEDNKPDSADDVDPAWSAAPLVTKPGDLWLLGKHRLLCGDARNTDDLARLMGSERAAMGFLDVPFNVHVRGIVGRGKIKHDEFAMASGEMSREAFVEFLKVSLRAAASVTHDGGLNYVCIDWRHIRDVLEAGESVYGDTLNVVVWSKTNAGQGSFYRSKHELIVVFRVGDVAHQNNIELGRHGRSRSNVWEYPGVNTFRTGRMDDLAAHPTVKPTALVADAMRDCTARGDIVLDSFCGSGTTILAAERVGRRGFGIEISPGFVDVAIRRWQSFTRKDAIHAETGLAFDETFNTALKNAA
jgi:DNA modification methylase